MLPCVQEATPRCTLRDPPADPSIIRRGKVSDYAQARSRDGSNPR